MKKTICDLGHCRVSQVILALIVAIVFTACATEISKPDKMQPPPTDEVEFAKFRADLQKIKKVDQWRVPGDTSNTGGIVVDLTVSECVWLGGTVEYWSGCSGTLMKCVGANGREICIDKVE